MARILAIVQARLSSTRLPKKVLKEVNGKSLIQILLSRLSNSKKIEEIVVATSTSPSDDTLENHVVGLGFKCFRGSESNVLERFYDAANFFSGEVIIRITADCPLIDFSLVDRCIERYFEQNVDYCSNTLPESFPDGLDVEVFSYRALKICYENSKTDFEKEHVTPYLRFSENIIRSSLQNEIDLSNRRWTVDEYEDYILIERIFKYFQPNILFSWLDVLELEKIKPEIFALNSHIIRNEGSYMSKGQKLYKRAKKLIPGGTMLLSKRPEMFLPEKWPAYFSKAKDCYVWDLDGNKFTDVSIMGIGTNILGYGNEEVDEAVRAVVTNGNMSTFNCPEEVYLAERLVEIHPWADMVRFARSGGEINSISIRIARAFTNKDKIAICGYHGWHDWYLATNLKNESNLDSHLLPGLEPIGVPSGLSGSVIPFRYNKIEELEEIIKKNRGQIAAIKMEVSRNEEPHHGFLQKVRDLATENNIILIFDECTSGFRETFGGLHKKYDVEPDMAIFGKALGNGYAITACIGKEKFMNSAQKTFISSTFWTERIGPAAALKTLEVMEKNQSWKKITNTGRKIKKRWQRLADSYSLDLETWGMDALCGFTIKSKNHLIYKTYITQEMLKKGFLAGNSVYVSMAHSDSILDEYFEYLDKIFKVIKNYEDNSNNPEDLLEGPVCHSSFERLN